MAEKRDRPASSESNGSPSRKQDVEKPLSEHKSSGFTYFLHLIPMFIGISMMFYVLYMDYIANNNSFSRKDLFFSNLPFVKYDRNLSQECSNDYDTDRVKFPRCAPKKNCGRLFNDLLLTNDEANLLQRIAKTVFKYVDPKSPSAKFDLVSGTLTQASGSTNIFDYMKSKNMQLFSNDDFQSYINVRNKIKQKLMEYYEVDEVYATKPTIFSYLTNNEAKSKKDEYWHDHIDSKVYPSFRYTAVITLSLHYVDVDGGRFEFVKNNGKDELTSFQPKLGRVILFTSGTENIHHDERVEFGQRYALTIGFTCDKSLSIEN